jgi:uncharacterized protein (TIGR02444 family)
MNANAAPPVREAGLWSFSLRFYAHPGVAEALIALQDDAGLDVNLILYALWLGLCGRGRLDANAADSARETVRILAARIIEPLRALRRRLKSDPEPDIQRLRERIKTLELEAERAALDRLAVLAGRFVGANPETRLADAEANLALVLGPAGLTQAASVLCQLFGDFARETLTPPSAARPSA